MTIDNELVDRYRAAEVEREKAARIDLWQQIERDGRQARRLG